MLYKRDGFTPEEIAKLNAHTKAMSFDEIYYPGIKVDTSRADADPAGLSRPVLLRGRAGRSDGAVGEGAAATSRRPAATPAPTARPKTKDEAPPRPRVPATVLGRLAWHYLINGGWQKVADDYVFDTRILTNHQPYFAAYIKVKDLLKFTDRLELVQDEWGYLLLWATLGIATVFALTLVLFPVVFGWRTIFSRYPGKVGTLLYFLCLGLGYIIVEVGMISHFILALSNATVSASVLITGMLVFSGFGSFFSERYLDRARTRDAEDLPRDLRASWRSTPSPSTTRSTGSARLPYALRIVLLPAADLAAGLPDGLPHADGDDDARPPRQGPHVPVGLGHQRLLLGDRRRAGADRGDQLRPARRRAGRRLRLSRGPAGLLLRADAARQSGGRPAAA